MISKELLEEIVHYTPFDIHQSGNNIRYQLEISRGMKHGMNVYELAHKCKEWASNIKHNNQNTVETMYQIRSTVDRFGGHAYLHTSPISIAIGMHENTEPEAIFQACEYILKENK